MDKFYSENGIKIISKEMELFFIKIINLYLEIFKTIKFIMLKFILMIKNL